MEHVCCERHVIAVQGAIAREYLEQQSRKRALESSGVPDAASADVDAYAAKPPRRKKNRTNDDEDVDFPDVMPVDAAPSSTLA